MVAHISSVALRLFVRSLSPSGSSDKSLSWPNCTARPNDGAELREAACDAEIAMRAERQSCRSGGPGISPPAATRDALLRAVCQRLMFMDRMNHLRPEIPAMYVSLVNALV